MSYSMTRIAGLLLAGVLTANVASASQAHYSIDWRGLNVGEITFDLEHAETAYRIAYEVRSTGILAFFFAFESRGYSSGIVLEDRLIATSHSAISTVRGEARSWSVGFGLDGEVAHLEVQEDDERETVPMELRKAPDPLALALSAIKDASPGAKLGGQSFDGRRAIKVDMTCQDPGPDPLELICNLQGELLAGASKRWQDEDGDDPPAERPVTVTLARHVLGEGWWPVRLAVDSKWGPVTAQLVRESAELRP